MKKIFLYFSIFINLYSFEIINENLSYLNKTKHLFKGDAVKKVICIDNVKYIVLQSYRSLAITPKIIIKNNEAVVEQCKKLN